MHTAIITSRLEKQSAYNKKESEERNPVIRKYIERIMRQIFHEAME